MKNKDRLQALQILKQVLEKHRSFSQVLPSTASALTKALCYGVCRHYFRLEVLADIFLEKRPKDQDIWLVILLGLFQLYWLNQPDYAVVKETVDLLVQIRKTWSKSLVNAVLRRACRERDTVQEALRTNPAWIHGHPAWLLNHLQSSWPASWEQIVKANDRHPPMTLRVNTGKNTSEQYGQLLKAANIGFAPHETATEALILTEPTDVHALPGFKEGLVSVQDAAAQQAAHLMDLKPGLRILDACCAPGGKTGHMLELFNDLDCTAVDVDEKRLERVKENLDRLQLQATCIQGDMCHVNTWWNGNPFDRILLDAPCSATGVTRRHPDIKLLRTMEDVYAVAVLQKAMLETAWSMLADKGLLVYATCSILPEENAHQMKQFLENHKDCRLRFIDKPWGVWTDYGRQIITGDQNMDGFFYSVLEKCK